MEYFDDIARGFLVLSLMLTVGEFLMMWGSKPDKDDIHEGGTDEYGDEYTKDK
jgi:hypothetical protein